MIKQHQLRRRHFDRAIGGAENPDGFTAQTANGTAHAMGTGWNRGWGYRESQPQISVDKLWPGGRTNRTGE